jgi:ribosomal protein S25
MKMKKFIGIDLSLNSTAISIICGNSIKIISIFKTENNIDRIFEKKDHFSLIKKCSDVDIILENKKDSTKKEYHINEREKILSFMRLNELIMESIKDDINDETYIGMEGISFGSTGNSLIDISMATGIVRKSLVEKISNDVDRFFIFSPSSIKKFAGKGNFKKIEMFDAILKESEIDSEFIKTIRLNREACVTPKGVVKKPIEDMVDSIWICKFLKHQVENG